MIPLSVPYKEESSQKGQFLNKINTKILKYNTITSPFSSILLKNWLLKDLGEDAWNSTQMASGIPQSQAFVLIRCMSSNGFCLKEFRINLMSCLSENSEKATVLDRVKSRWIKLANLHLMSLNSVPTSLLFCELLPRV